MKTRAEMVIEKINEMNIWGKLSIYMDYFINYNTKKILGRLYFRIVSFEEFISQENIIINDVGEDWKERNFACRKWVVFVSASIYNYVDKEIKIFKEENC